MAVIGISRGAHHAAAAKSSTLAADQRQPLSWRLTGIGLLRITFGIVWAIDAWLKWRPGSDFFNNFTGHVAMSLDGQPQAIQAWIQGWMHVVHALTPAFCAHVIGIIEVALAIGLIGGLFSNMTYITGIVLSLVIWTTAEGFGGPYDSSTVDIGAAIIYVLVFSGLFLSSAGLFLGLDRYLAPRLGRWSFLASGPLKKEERQAQMIPVTVSPTQPDAEKTPHTASPTPTRSKTSHAAKHTLAAKGKAPHKTRHKARQRSR